MELTLSNIILACHKSPNFDSLLQLGVTISNKFNAKLHVILPDSESNAAVGNKLSSADHTLQTIHNLSYKDLIHTANKIDADLVIVSTNNKESKEGLLSFADTVKLIDNLKKPILTIPSSCTTTSFEKILIPIDTSYETRQKGPLTIGIGKKFNSLIQIIGVSGDKDKDSENTVNNYSRQVSNKINENGLNSTIEVRLGGNITDQTLAYAKEIKPDLAVIMTEQEVNFKSFFTGKYSEQLVKQANFPILNISPQDLIVSDARL